MLRNYRAIREYRLELPATGVVVIEGENEAGKSSIAEALWLVFEVPDSSDSERVRSIKPVDRDAATEIELEVSSGPYRFAYSKRFHRSPRTELRVETPRPEHLTGREAHTGSTPMNMRVNAGLAMARIFEMVQTVAMENQPGAVGGVGQVKFSPNSRNVLPGTVVFTVDIRSPDLGKLQGMRARIEAEAARIAAALGVGCSVELVGHFDPVTFDPTLVSRVRSAAEKLGYSHMNLISGAGHDACWAAKVAPATMVMCPCVGGLSHNEAEDISKEWATAGADVLFHAVVETAEIVA